MTEHNRDSNRVLVLTPMEGKNSLTNTGMIDNQLFTGKNNLHAIMDKETCLWYLQYDSGVLPQPLKQRFTSFNKLKSYITEYFKRRNINLKEVID